MRQNFGLIDLLTKILYCYSADSIYQLMLTSLVIRPVEGKYFAATYQELMSSEAPVHTYYLHTNLRKSIHIYILNSQSDRWKVIYKLVDYTYDASLTLKWVLTASKS